MSIVQVEDLTVGFGVGKRRIDACQAVTLSIEPNESFGLVGESGSGKTTILRCLCGLVDHRGGEVLMDGKPLAGYGRIERTKDIQIVFQDPYGSLHPHKTVDALLREPLTIHRMSGHDGRILDSLRAVGLGAPYRFRYPHQLSGGQRQRVAIARALILEPRVLLLDEPTSALDVSVQAEILNLLSDLRESKGLTYLLVSHDLAVVAHMCERVAIMYRGRIVETLSSDALMQGRAVHEYTRSLIASSRA